MIVTKTESETNLVKLDDLKSGDLFEYSNYLYIKSNKPSTSGRYETVVCILLYNGHFCEFVHDIEVYPARLVNNELNYEIDAEKAESINHQRELNNNSNTMKVDENLYKFYEIIPVDDLKDENKLKKMPFIVQDLAGIAIYLNKPICNIENYDANCKERKQDRIINDCIEYLGKENYIFATTAYVSVQEYPKSKYYNSFGGLRDDSKIPVPFDTVIEQQSIMLEEIGFTNINNICNLEFSEAYLYTDSELGKKVLIGLQLV